MNWDSREKKTQKDNGKEKGDILFWDVCWAWMHFTGSNQPPPRRPRSPVEARKLKASMSDIPAANIGSSIQMHLDEVWEVEQGLLGPLSLSPFLSSSLILHCSSLSESSLQPACIFFSVFLYFLLGTLLCILFSSWVIPTNSL